MWIYVDVDRPRLTFLYLELLGGAPVTKNTLYKVTFSSSFNYVVCTEGAHHSVPRVSPGYALGRGWRVGFFNFGSDMDRVSEKNISGRIGYGPGTDRVRVLSSYIESIGYYWVLKSLIGYGSGISIFVTFNLWIVWLDINFWISHRACYLVTLIHSREKQNL